MTALYATDVHLDDVLAALNEAVDSLNRGRGGDGLYQVIDLNESRKNIERVKRWIEEQVG